MKIASYNIMSGGFSDYRYDLRKPERLPVIVRAVKGLKADIIGLFDTFRWDEIYSINTIIKMFEYTYAHCINLNDNRLKKIGHNNGITVLSNQKVTFETIHLGTRDAIKTTIQKNSNLVDIFHVYLDDKSEDSRLEQINHLFTYIKPDCQTLITGDLNSFSAADVKSVGIRAANFVHTHPQYSKRLYEILEKAKRDDVIKTLLDKGFIDASDKKENTVPTKLLSPDFEKPMLRLDYAFSRGISISNFKVITGTPYTRASDHYPIVFEI